VQEYLELPPKAKFRDIVSNEKLRAGIDGVIDQELVADIIKKTDMEAPQIEQQLHESVGEQRIITIENA